MNESLRIANVYAAYTAAANKSDKSVSELSKMVRTDAANTKESDNPSLRMDTVIISKEALERLSGVSLAAVGKERA